MKILFFRRIGIFFVLLLFSFSFARAEILVSPPSSTIAVTGDSEGDASLFCDVYKESIYYDALKELKWQGMVKGDENGCFRPEKPITKADFVSLLGESRFFTREFVDKGTYKVPGPYFHGSYVIRENPFKDVSEKDSYFDDMMLLYEEGALKVGHDKKFRGQSFINKGEALELMYNVSRQLQRVQPTTRKIPFLDVQSNRSYFKAIFSIWQHKLLIGNEGKKFKPNSKLKRGEAAIYIQNFIDFSTTEPEYL